jgi:transmembrane sensor
MEMPSQAIKPDLVAEASSWFIEFRSGDMTNATRARFDDWLRRSPEHIQAYLEIAAAWSELPTADPEARIAIPELLVRARAVAEENVIPLSPLAQRVSRPRASKWTLPLAASVACLVFAIASFWFFISGRNTYSTGIGQQRTVMLADGSTIVLNALTSIRIRVTRQIREVDLIQGQALFHDVQDKKRPFIVRSDGTIIRAIGTQFDVYNRSEQTVVTVVEGEVAVDQAGSSPFAFNHPFSVGAEPHYTAPKLAPLLLSAGEQVVATTRRIAKPEHANVQAVTAWVERRLIFDDTPLEKVAAQFNLYSARPLVIADPALRSIGISGVYSSADPVALIDFLRAQPSLTVTETNQEIIVSLHDR